MGLADRPCPRALPPFRQEVRAIVRRLDGSSAIINSGRGRGSQDCPGEMATPGNAAVDPSPAYTGLRVVVGSVRCAAQAGADRIISVD